MIRGNHVPARLFIAPIIKRYEEKAKTNDHYQGIFLYFS